MSAVVKLKTPSSPASKVAPKQQSAAMKRKLSRQRTMSYVIGLVGITLTGLSLSHLADGVQQLTHSSPWHAWAMATGIDFGFVSLELGQLAVATEALRRQVSKWCKPAILGTLVASAMMNAYAFAAQAEGTTVMVAACLLGCAIPAMIYVLSRVSVAMWIDAHR